ncbi:pirin family protein [Vibrio sp. NTOU-M3]|uniref:pirin family protein n=1 Tax=unclassified Vibrio TaxID=2614977 RepID=UPI00349F6ADE
MTTQRKIKQIIASHPTSDGDGVQIRRVAGFNNASFSPFLMIDELKSDNSADYIGGFPPHPHRGIETLTYMLNGHFQHKDHMGNVGELRSGGAQWMAAGKGVIHSEMPIMDKGSLHGFQIWINQPAELKMSPARYHDFQSETIMEYQQDGMGLLRVIAGQFDLKSTTVRGPLDQTGVPLNVADWRASRHSDLQFATSSFQNAMLYVYQGSVIVEDIKLSEGELGLLSLGDEVSIQTENEAGVLVFTGDPIDEPVVHYGPFVMNSIEEIEQAIKDYNSGSFAQY